MIDISSLIKKCSEFDINITQDKAALMDKFAELLITWNKNINLTAIVDPEEIVDKHFIDSLLILKAADIKHKAKLLDVGTGAGFPSTPISIVRDDICVTQMDSLNKRVMFLQEIAQTLDLNIKPIHARAEEYGKKQDYRESFDIVTARAVSKLNKLLEYCLPFVKIGGIFVAMKGSEYEDELEKSKCAVKTLGGVIEKIVPFALPDKSKRTIILIKKISHTPTKYPRNYSKISKSPI